MGALPWDEEEVYVAPGRWQAAEPRDWPVLVRAWQAGGWKAHAWARKVDGKTARVPLTWDEARRTMLAVDADAGKEAVLDEVAAVLMERLGVVLIVDGKPWP